MQPIRSLVLIAALLCVASGVAPSRVSASSAHEQVARVAGVWQAMALPAMHVRCSGGAVRLEMGIRRAKEKIESSDAVRVIVAISRSGEVEFLLETPSMDLALPRRGV
jgi:hypothetical protein